MSKKPIVELVPDEGLYNQDELFVCSFYLLACYHVMM